MRENTLFSGCPLLFSELFRIITSVNLYATVLGVQLASSKFIERHSSGILLTILGIITISYVLTNQYNGMAILEQGSDGNPTVSHVENYRLSWWVVHFALLIFWRCSTIHQISQFFTIQLGCFKPLKANQDPRPCAGGLQWVFGALEDDFVAFYPLVNVYIAMERSTIFNGKIHYKWQFSIAMLNYQRVGAQTRKEFSCLRDGCLVHLLDDTENSPPKIHRLKRKKKHIKIATFRTVCIS